MKYTGAFLELFTEVISASVSLPEKPVDETQQHCQSLARRIVQSPDTNSMFNLMYRSSMNTNCVVPEKIRTLPTEIGLNPHPSGTSSSFR